MGGVPDMSDVRSLLAHNMKRCREIRGLSQMALAEKVGCSTTLIGNIEVKKRFPSAENLDRIAAALGIPPGELFVDESTAIDKMESVYELRGRLEKRLLDAVNEVFEKPSGE